LADLNKPIGIIIDFITGKEIPDVGPEANRQRVERVLVKQKGYAKEDIEVDAPLEVEIAEKVYRSSVDLVVSADGRRLMAVKCVPGSLGSREREIIAASRLLDNYQIPFSVASDGQTAIVLDTVSGKKLGEGLNFIPSKEEIKKSSALKRLVPLPEKRLEKEKLIFRSYDSMNVNVKRNM
jgi:intergrase/recombinase